MKIKIKKVHSDATIPEYATTGAACFDIKTIEHGDVSAQGARTFRTGLAFAIPSGYALMIYSRSGSGFKHGIRLGNAVGVLDSDYTGELLIRIHNDSNVAFSFNAGERIAQARLELSPQVEFELVDELESTERGDGGFGSTGK